jgi:enoyl-CoA hydratase/carnithine racemase
MTDSAPTPPELLVDIRNHVAHITLNRPAALNALSMSMIRGLTDYFTRFALDDGVKAIVLKGSGEKSFCAGGDIRFLRDSAVGGRGDHLQFFIEEYQLNYLLHRYVKPVICVLDGIVMGGGMGISQGSGYRIVGPKTKMAMPETVIGLIPDVGGSYFLSRSPLGMYLALTGSTIKAPDALAALLADRYMSTEAIGEMLTKLENHHWRGPTLNDAVADIAAMIEDHASAPDSSPLATLKPVIDQHFAPQKSVAEMVASLEAEARPELAAWAQQNAALLRKRSPTMLEVTRRLLNRGSKLALADCFRMELGAIYQAFEDGDAIEGIRAVIIDKDHAPQWRPATLAEVQPAKLDAYFAPRWTADNHPLAALEKSYG